MCARNRIHSLVVKAVKTIAVYWLMADVQALAGTDSSRWLRNPSLSIQLKLADIVYAKSGAKMWRTRRGTSDRHIPDYRRQKFINAAREAGYSSWPAYIRDLKRGEKAEYLVDGLLTNTLNHRTSPFRCGSGTGWLRAYLDRSHRVTEAIAGRSPLMIWSVGCSDGTEPLSIAICVREAFRKRVQSAPNATIWGTDVCQSIVEKASAEWRIFGEGYGDEFDDVMTEAKIADHFERRGDYHRAHSDISQMMTFAKHNVLESPPRRDFDVIFFNNVASHLDQKARDTALSNIASAVRPGGLVYSDEQLFNVEHGKLSSTEEW